MTRVSGYPRRHRGRRPPAIPVGHGRHRGTPQCPARAWPPQTHQPRARRSGRDGPGPGHLHSTDPSALGTRVRPAIPACSGLPARSNSLSSDAFTTDRLGNTRSADPHRNEVLHTAACGRTPPDLASAGAAFGLLGAALSRESSACGSGSGRTIRTGCGGSGPCLRQGRSSPGMTRGLRVAVGGEVRSASFFGPSEMTGTSVPRRAGV